MNLRSAILRTLPLWLAFGAGACTSEPSGPALSPETFIDVMVALRRAHEAHPEPAAFEAERTRILQDAGVTDSLLIHWVESRGSDPQFLAALWDTINTRLTVVVEDSVG